jgi:hypothetical protein
MAQEYAPISETTTIMECCICFEDVKPEEAYKYWECDNHYTCRQCGSSLNKCPLCRKPCGSYTPRSCVPSNEGIIREDWKQEAIKKGLWKARPLGVDEDYNDNKYVIQAWNTEGRSIMSSKMAIKLNIQDIRLSW